MESSSKSNLSVGESDGLKLSMFLKEKQVWATQGEAEEQECKWNLPLSLILLWSLLSASWAFSTARGRLGGGWKLEQRERMQFCGAGNLNKGLDVINDIKIQIWSKWLRRLCLLNYLLQPKFVKTSEFGPWALSLICALKISQNASQKEAANQSWWPDGYIGRGHLMFPLTDFFAQVVFSRLQWLYSIHL